MKKLYRKGTVHPSPPIISDHLSFLPAAILTLTAALSPEDREVLAYLISCSSSSSVNDFHGHRKNTTIYQQKTVSFAKTRSTGGGGSANSNDDHTPLFNCDCFRCYMSYWVRWDNSPNRQLIHEIIDAFEDDHLARTNNNNNNKNKKTKNNSKKEKKKRGGGGRSSGNDNSGELKRSSADHHHHQLSHHELAESESSAENTGGGGDVEEVNTEKGPVRSFVSFIGEKIWGVWG
ncbi:hypothetical protein JRO89_XS06G0154400 [Xanthoceras sorbifolium]|uniref:Uncharacterized protein n=1 Tax=Xanthoceras sorbifolium TaxID=99658 RepID=A0ABQ8HYU8_9ROSI|nr:hypothetical protein JRO89_XS06G0154400 [Xanthoceras sorbifolium]